MADLWQDLRYALRMLVKNPGFTAVAIIALALGIGANSAIFSVVNTVLLRRLPYKDADRLVMVWEDATKHGYPRDTPAVANYIDWRDQNQVFESMAAIADESFNLTGAGEPERIEGRRVPPICFRCLASSHYLDARSQRKKISRAAIVWSSSVMAYGNAALGADANIIGKPLTLNGESFTVVGVMPAQFQFPTRDDELWVPIAFTQANPPAAKDIIYRSSRA